MIKCLSAGFAADLIYYFKKQLIADFCLKYNFKKVFMATTGHKIATQLLA